MLKLRGNPGYLLFRVARLLAVFIFLASLTASAPVAVFGPAPVDAQVLADTAGGQVSSFIVLLKEQADLAAIEDSIPLFAEAYPAEAAAGGPLSLASETAAWKARGEAVVAGLRETASSSQPAVISALQAAGAVYRPYWVVNAIVVEGNRALISTLAARPDVARLESNHPFRVPLETPAAQSAPQSVDTVEPGLSQVHATDLWAKGITGVGTVFASADTGVDWTHPALKTHYRGWDAGNNTANHNTNWWDAIHSNFGSNSCGHDTQSPCDDYGHGTHTTGTGIGDDGLGNQIGMAPGAKWIACRNMDSGTGRPQYYIECLQFFIAPTDLKGNNPDPWLRPDVINNSYSCPIDELCAPHSLQAAVEAVRTAGIFMSVSAGNSGSKCESVGDPPGLEASVFTVGAVDSFNQITSFSSRGPVTIDGSGRLKPQLVAPGDNVRSSIPGASYGGESGTSMSAPHVGGAVLLLWSGFLPLRANVALTERLLEQTASPLTTDQGCGTDTPTSVPNNVYGYGLLNVAAAYQQAQVAVKYLFFPNVLK